MRCDHCGAEVTNGLALCQTCRYGLLVNLEFLPVYFRNLSRWRPSSSGIRRVPGSREPVGSSAAGAGDRIGRLLDQTHADLTGWARSLADDRPQLAPIIDRILRLDEEPCVRLLCALLTKRVDTLMTLPWADPLVTAVGKSEAALRYETERAMPGWYAGACRHCQTATYVVPGLTWVTCGGCGTATSARDHLETILGEAREWVARPLRLAEAVVALVDTELSVPRLHDRIRQWSARERIGVVRRLDADGDSVGPKRYRMGDILDRLQAEGATRLDAKARPTRAVS